jgi:hypothetical protein
MMGQEDGHSARSNLPWLTEALNPVENLRAMADVQAFGRQAAENLADRILAWGDAKPGANRGGQRPHDSDQPTGAGSHADGAGLADVVEQLRGDAAFAGEVSTRLVQHTITLVGILIERFPRSAPSEPTSEALTLQSVVAGGEASAVFWVHNTSAAAVSAVRPHCAPPRSHLGVELPPDAVVFDPPLLDPLPARSTCGIEVRVRVPRHAEPGTYVSVVMASNVPDLYLPLQVTVQDQETSG